MPAATLLGLLRFLVDVDYRTRALARVTDPVVRVFWAKEYPALGKQFAAEVSAPVLNKLGALASPVVRRIVGQAAPRLDFRQVMDYRRILLVDLSGIGRDAAQFIGAIIVTGLDLAAHARATSHTTERPPFLLVADEFQSYLTRSFLTLLAEGRKFGICAALAHQHAAQLDPETRAAILGNAGTLGAFSLSADDAKAILASSRPNSQPKTWSACDGTTSRFAFSAMVSRNDRWSCAPCRRCPYRAMYRTASCASAPNGTGGQPSWLTERFARRSACPLPIRKPATRVECRSCVPAAAYSNFRNSSIVSPVPLTIA